MPYSIVKSDGNTLVTIVDGTRDDIHTDLTLIGKNFTGFGKVVNENFVKLLENFASAAQPTRPLVGQTWYDTSQGRLKIYAGTDGGWKGANGTLVSDQQPILPSTGDIWIDSKEKKMYFYVGVNRFDASKPYNDTQGMTGVITDDTTDNSGNTVSILKLYVANQLMGIFSSTGFTLGSTLGGESVIPDFSNLVSGFTANPTIDFTFDTTVSKSQHLLSLAGGSFVADDFLKRTASDTTLGKITIKNDGGLTLGAYETANFKIDGNDLDIENVANGGNILIKTKVGTDTITSVIIDSSNQYVGIGTEVPERTLHVEGNMKVSGPLRMANLSSSAIGGLNPQLGDVVYNTTTNKFQGYDNTGWVNLS